MNRIVGFLVKVSPLCGQRCARWTIWVLSALLLLFPVDQYVRLGGDYTQWDLLLFTGIVVFIFGLRLAARLPDRFADTIARLEQRRVLQFGEGTRARFLGDLAGEGDAWARGVGVVCALAIAVAFAVAARPDAGVDWLLLGAAESIGGYICGNYLGRMIGYGRLGYALQRHENRGLVIDVDPLHVDGVGGLKPVGDFYFFQAMIAALPAMFLGVWWFMFPLWPRDYSHWQESYLALLGVAICVEILAFLLPVWSFHRVMLVRKRALLNDADALSRRIHDLEYGGAAAPAATLGEQGMADVAKLKARYWAYENMPTWPVDVTTRKRFKVNNLLLLVPLVADIAKRGVDWQRLSSVLGAFFSP